MDALTAAAEAADTTRPEEGLRAVAALRRFTDTLELAQVEAAKADGVNMVIMDRAWVLWKQKAQSTK